MPCFDSDVQIPQQRNSVACLSKTVRYTDIHHRSRIRKLHVESSLETLSWFGLYSPYQPVYHILERFEHKSVHCVQRGGKLNLPMDSSSICRLCRLVGANVAAVWIRCAASCVSIR